MNTLRLNNGMFVVISREDVLYLHQWKWSLSGDYAFRSERLAGKTVAILMQREVAKRAGLHVVAGTEVDHINRNKLDNRRENLRAGDKSANQHNVGVRRDSSTGHRGISVRKKDGAFKVRIQFNKKRREVGVFLTLQEAVEAHAQAVKEGVTGLGKPPAKLSQEVVSQRISQGQKEYWSHPEHHNTASQNHQSPEIQKRHREAALRRWQRNSYRAKQISAQTLAWKTRRQDKGNDK